MQTAFGWVEIDDHRYENDVIVHANGEVSKRKKKRSRDLKGEYGHTPLSDRELDILDKEEPEVVIIGTGQDGDLPITPEAMKVLAKYVLIIEPTPMALERMASERRRYVAFLHVTC